MFGHIMENWNWSDVPYIEIEPRTECFGKCDRLTNEIEKGFGDALVMSAKHDNWEGCLTNENFGCVLFISNAKL